MYLRQSTASQEITLGRFLDSTDGNTEETALSIASTDIKVWKEGATSLANKNSGGATHIANGIYYCVLDATDTDTVGKLEVHTHVSGALATKGTFYVLEEAVYDAFFGASAVGYVANAPVNVAQFGGTNGTFASGVPAVNTTQIEGSDATNQIRDAVVDDATRIDASALNTLSSHDPGEAIMGATDLGTGTGFTAIPWNAAWDAEVQSECTDALNAYDPPTNAEMEARTLASANYATASALATVDGIADSIMAVTDKLDTTLEDDGSSGWQFTTLALENAPSGGGGGGTDWTADERTAIRTILGFNGSGVVGDPTSGILDTIRDDIATRQATFTAATGITFPANFGSLSVNGSGHVTLADSSLTTAKLGTFALAKTTNITGFNDLSAAQVNTEADTALADVGLTTTVTGRIDAAVTSRPTLTEILAGGDVDGYTLEQTLKLCLAALAGKISGAETTTITIRAADDSKARITATVDADGNRTAATLDAAG